MQSITARALWPGAVAVALLAAGPAPAQTQQPAAPPQAVETRIPSNLRPYFVVFLVNPGEARPMSSDLFARHQAYLRQQFEAGTYRFAGPLTDGGRIRGMAILSAETLDQARAIAEADPAVQEGLLAVELHPAMFPDLSGVRVEYR